ncbi:MAG TPA: hypothetical protein VF529_01300 [Solirubrobacteraceae bacterium]|jgi:hypothetical protein
MSAWRIGAEVATSDTGPQAFGLDEGTAADDAGAVIDQLTKWIPGDALALYVAAVTAFAAREGAQPSPALLIAFVVLAALFVVGGAFASSGEIQRTVILRTILAAVAFAIWSLSVPFSGWNRWDLIAENQAEVAIGAAVFGVLFGFGAEGFTKREANAGRR